MAGIPSENVQLVVFDLALQTYKTLKVNDFGREQYLTNITWSPDGKSIFVQVLNRDQKEMHLNQYAAENGKFIKDNSPYDMTFVSRYHDSREMRVWVCFAQNPTP